MKKLGAQDAENRSKNQLSTEDLAIKTEIDKLNGIAVRDLDSTMFDNQTEADR